MPDNKALDTFIKAADNADVEHLLEKDPFWGPWAKGWEKRGQELLDGLLRKKQKAGNPTNLTVPSTAQSAFLAPEDESPLYNVATSDKKPFWQSTKQLFSDIDYGIEDWNVLMRLNKGDKKYDFILGEKTELRYKFDQKSWTQKQINVGINNRTGRARLRYSVSTPAFGAGAEVFQKNDNIGGSFGYTNRTKNWSASVSADKYNAAGSFDIRKKNIIPEYDMKFGVYGNFNYTKPEERIIGVSCRFIYLGK